MTASIKWRMRELLASYGIQVSLTPTNPHLEDFLISRRIDTVLDVGANIGQFAQRIRSHGYDGRIISFEPVSSVYETLINAARSDPLWETRQLALGDCSGSKLINISKSTVYSSFDDLPLSFSSTRS